MLNIIFEQDSPWLTPFWVSLGAFPVFQKHRSFLMPCAGLVPNSPLLHPRRFSKLRRLAGWLDRLGHGVD